jgi:hypothetical protein
MSATRGRIIRLDAEAPRQPDVQPIESGRDDQAAIDPNRRFDWILTGDSHHADSGAELDCRRAGRGPYISGLLVAAKPTTTDPEPYRPGFLGALENPSTPSNDKEQQAAKERDQRDW